MPTEKELDEKALAVLAYVRAGKKGRRWSDCEKEFVKERGWSNGTFVKYWKEAKPFFRKEPDPRTGRFRYFVSEEFEVEPEKAILRRRLKESEIFEESSVGLPNDLKERFLPALGNVVEENVYRNPFKAWELIENLMETTPQEFKERIRPFFAAATKVYNEQWEFKYPTAQAKARVFVRRKIVPFLVDKFSSLLYGDAPQKSQKSDEK